jgi:hypothetical protein
MEPPVKTIVAEVIAVIPEFEQTVCRANGYQYSVTRKASGPGWDTLKEGDVVTLEVLVALPIVKKVINVNP